MQKLFRGLGVAPENGGLLGSMYFAFFTSGLTTVMLGTILPYIHEENTLSYSQSGFLLSANQIGNLCALLLAGVLPYTIGRKRSALLLGVGSVFGPALIAIPGGWWLLLIAFVLTGVGKGMMGNLCNAVVSSIAGNKTSALNLLHGVFAFGGLLSAPLVFVCGLNSGPGWNAAVIAAAAFAGMAWMWLALGGLKNEKEGKANGGSFAFLRDKQLWSGTMILFFYLCAEASIIGWFVAYFQETGVLAGLTARFVPTMLWMMILVGRVLCAMISSRISRRLLLLALSAGVTLCFAGLLFSRSATVCTAFLLGLGLTMGGVYPTAFATIKGTDSPAATGFVIAFASLGAIIMPGIVGTIADVYGLKGGVSTVMAALFCMTALVAARLAAKNHAQQ